MTEIFKDIEGYENYQVSNLGTVKSLNYRRTGNEQLLKPSKDGCGYLYVALCKDGKRKMKTVHRLVFEAFYGPIPKGLEVNHIDENKENNCLENLNLMTHQENNNWGTHNERIAEALGKQVLQLTSDGTLVKIWPSTWECDRNGFNQGAVAACCRNCFNREGNNIYKGFIWQYA